MRFILGIILGIALTIGGAYIHDATASSSSVTGNDTIAVEHRPMVNWDVVSANWRELSTSVRTGWNKLTASG